MKPSRLKRLQRRAVEREAVKLGRLNPPDLSRCCDQSKVGLKPVTVASGFLTREHEASGIIFSTVKGTKTVYKNVPSMGRYNPTANEKRKYETARNTLGL